MASRLVYCRECGKMIPAKARRCEFCHEKQGKGLKKRSFSRFILIAVLVLYLAYGGYSYIAHGFWPVFGKTVYYETGGWNGYRIYYTNYGLTSLHAFNMNDYKPESSASSAKLRKYLDSFESLVDTQYSTVKGTDSGFLKALSKAYYSFGNYDIAVYISMIDPDKLNASDRIYYEASADRISAKLEKLRKD